LGEKAREGNGSEGASAILIRSTFL
jgi:hypothetical protein